MVFLGFSLGDHPDRMAWLLPSASYGYGFRVCAADTFRHRLPGGSHSRRLRAARPEHTTGFGFRITFAGPVNR